MAVTEQQFIESYKGLDADKQKDMYNSGNAQVKSWIDNYNASQNNYTDGTNLGNWGYGDTSIDRQEEIVNNLSDAYQQDPSKFSDWNTFAKNFNYNYSGRSDRERETMKNWYEYQIGQNGGMDYNNINNTDYLLGQLINGQALGGTGAAVTAAQNRYKNYQSLSAMTPDQIASAIASNSINPVGQEMQDLKNYSPALYAQVQAAMQGQTQVDDINALGEGIYNGLTNTETNKNYTNYDFTTEYAKNASVIKQYNESLYKKIEGLGGDTAAYVAIVASMLQNPLIQANKDEVENLEGEIRKIQENIYTVGDTARSRLGSEAPEDLVSAYISQQTKDLQNQLRTAQNSLLVAQGKLNNQLTEVETMIDAINNGVKLYGEGTGGSNYQYISASKYQDAGYFDKSTGQFYKLGEQPDTRDYQSDDPTRLQEIRDNLDAIADSDSAYVFRDRNAFNDYFKYSQRGAAQKAVLDEYWNANAARLKPIADKKYKQYLASQKSVGRVVGGGNNSALIKIKKALINGSYQGNLTTGPKSYGYKNTAEPTQLMYQLGGVCDNAEEVAGLVSAAERFKNTSSESGTSFNVETLKDNILNGYWDAQLKKDKDTLLGKLEGKKKTSEIKDILGDWLISKGLDNTKLNRENLADDLGIDY